MPKGLVRLTAPVEIGTHVLAPALAEFANLYPGIQLDLVLEDAVLDLIGEKIDLAIRGGRLRDSSLIAKKVGTSNFRLYAGIEYLEKRPTIKTPKDLLHHRIIHFTGRGSTGKWLLVKGSQKQTVKIENPISVNSISLVSGLIERNAGVALLPHFLGEKGVQSGRLKEVLPGWGSEISSIYLVYPETKHLPLRTRLLIDFLVRKMDLQ
jgi:DNA-binding transcriptional LysR family regulator